MIYFFIKKLFSNFNSIIFLHLHIFMMKHYLYNRVNIKNYTPYFYRLSIISYFYKKRFSFLLYTYLCLKLNFYLTI
jgi:hypothetical protein